MKTVVELIEDNEGLRAEIANQEHLISQMRGQMRLPEDIKKIEIMTSLLNTISAKTDNIVIQEWIRMALGKNKY